MQLELRTIPLFLLAHSDPKTHEITFSEHADVPIPYQRPLGSSIFMGHERCQLALDDTCRTRATGMIEQMFFNYCHEKYGFDYPGSKWRK